MLIKHLDLFGKLKYYHRIFILIIRFLLPICRWLYSRIYKDMNQTVEQVVNSLTSNQTLRTLFSYYYIMYL